MIDIKKTFLALTTRRYPLNTEDLAMEIVEKILPDIDFKKDEFDNYYFYIPHKDGSHTDTMFTSHIDTVNTSNMGNTVNTYLNGKRWCDIEKRYVGIKEDKEGKKDNLSITHVFDGDFVKTDGNSNLGADDKAGITIMMNMISEKVPGLYYFFMGEESGCVGSSNLSRKFESIKEFPKMNKCISFDRRGYDSIITEQTSVCASDKFANELADRFNEYGFWFKPDPTGIYTDSAEFTDIIPECSNISCGYFSEHTYFEKQDLEFLELLSIVCTQIAWDTLPIVRNTDKIYKGKKSRHNYYGWGWNDDDDNEIYRNDAKQTKTNTINGNSNLSKIDNTNFDFDFDKWYGEQKTKSWVR